MSLIFTIAPVLHAIAAPPVKPSADRSANPPPLTRLQAIGQKLFFDRNLSEPAGTACVSCHNAPHGFAGNNQSQIGVPLGSRPGVFGLRNSMTNAYNRFVPTFSFQVRNGAVVPIGGHFWDGRADTLAMQALMPLLSTAEMNNPNVVSVVTKVAASGYSRLFRAEFGDKIFSSPDQAFQKIGEAIAAFESSFVLRPFSSKYDMYIQGKIALAPNEERGMRLFMDTKRANCASCHHMNPTSAKSEDSLFSDFSYHALGIPRNKAIPQNANPNFFDLGLCGPNRTKPPLGENVPADVSIEKFCGAFRMVSLRNVANRRTFMHNGVFKNLHEVVSFYSTRNSNPKRWYGAAGVPDDLPVAYIDNIIKDRPPFNQPQSAGPVLNLTEIDDVVAFLRTLSDGFMDDGPSTSPQMKNGAIDESQSSALNPFSSPFKIKH